ncbi:MAG: Calx-beta domain-containing protein [Woeseiaceae bacterium]|nr:Calx-beta domain-containing protein [Woeseiaceae bacterium]
MRIDEVGFSGSRSPGEAGHYRLSGDGVVGFDAGQRSATVTITPTSDSDREADRQVTLLLRDYYSAESELGQLEVRFLDDDQRRFEADLRENSVAFVTRRIAVRERDPAVQIDVIRYNPDQGTLAVPFSVVGDSATEGEDFFVPGRRFVTFGPGQRNARLLIPLVQDTVAEGRETFDIVIDDSAAANSTNNRITVIIGDDDTLDR